MADRAAGRLYLRPTESCALITRDKPLIFEANYSSGPRTRGTNVKVNSMRNALGSLFVVMASVMLGSCGGGGAASPGPIGGPPSIDPQVGTLYAGVEYTFTVAGGRPPYTLASSEPQLLAVPTILNGNFFTVVPNNTGVVDTGLPPGS